MPGSFKLQTYHIHHCAYPNRPLPAHQVRQAVTKSPRTVRARRAAGEYLPQKPVSKGVYSISLFRTTLETIVLSVQTPMVSSANLLGAKCFTECGLERREAGGEVRAYVEVEIVEISDHVYAGFGAIDDNAANVGESGL